MLLNTIAQIPKALAKQLLPLLAESGSVKGPYYFKGCWFSKREARNRRDALCSADTRCRLSKHLTNVTIEEMDNLNIIADEA